VCVLCDPWAIKQTYLCLLVSPTTCDAASLQGMDEGGLDYALNRAIDAYYNDKPWFRSLQVSPLYSRCRPAVLLMSCLVSALL
jgi:hypothetical protein